jgi:hypothetical protein
MQKTKCIRDGSVLPHDSRPGVHGRGAGDTWTAVVRKRREERREENNSNRWFFL